MKRPLLSDPELPAELPADEDDQELARARELMAECGRRAEITCAGVAELLAVLCMFHATFAFVAVICFTVGAAVESLFDQSPDRDLEEEWRARASLVEYSCYAVPVYAAALWKMVRVHPAVVADFSWTRCACTVAIYVFMWYAFSSVLMCIPLVVSMRQNASERGGPFDWEESRRPAAAMVSAFVAPTCTVVAYLVCGWLGRRAYACFRLTRACWIVQLRG